MTSGSSNNVRAAIWEWAQVALLVGNLWWTTLCLGGYRPETMVVTTALTGSLVVVHLLGWAFVYRPARGDGEGVVKRFHPAGWWLLPFLVYAAANVIWVTPVPWLGWLDWLGWAQLIAVFWVVLNGVRSRPARATLFGALMALGFVAVLLACYQKYVKPDWLMMGRTQTPQFIGRSGGPFGIPNSLAALLLLLLPPMLMLMARRGAGAVQRVLCGYVAFGFGFGLALTVSRGAWLALLLALSTWPFWARRGALGRRALASATVAALMLALLATLYFAVPLVRERLATMKRDSGELTRPIMWRGAWRIFQAHPAWGGGAGSYPILFDEYRPERFQDEPRWAHNDYLNTLSDYGGIGFLLFFGAGGAIAWRCRRREKALVASGDRFLFAGAGAPRALAAGWCGFVDDPLLVGAMAVGLAAFGLQLFVDFHFKIPALTLAFASVAALVVQAAWPRVESVSAPRGWIGRGGAVGTAVLVVTAMILWVTPFYRGEALRYGTRQAIDRLGGKEASRPRWEKVLGEANGVLVRAVELAPANGAAWADLAYAKVLTVHLQPERKEVLAREAERAADRALAISRAVPVFWVRRGVALDLQKRWSEADAAFAEAVWLAPARASIWFNYAFHLGLKPEAVERAKLALDYCLRLDGGNYEAQALRQRWADRNHTP